MNKTIISPENMARIIRMLGGGVGVYFDDLKVLQEAIDKKGTIPKDFFFNNGGCYETWGYEWRPKDELKAIRQEVIQAITKKLTEQTTKPYKEKMEASHYARYLHALAILNVNKDHFPVAKHDHILNAFVELWKIDDGSDEMWKAIDCSSRYISEAIKGFQGLYTREVVIPDEEESGN